MQEIPGKPVHDLSESKIIELSDDIGKLVNEDAGKYMKEWMGWMNHTKYNPCNLHFCSVITRENLDKVNGFDEIYSIGNWYDDNEFLERIKLICNVELIEETTNPFVIHLFHKSANIGSPDSGIGAGQEEIDNNPLIQKNKALFKNLMKKIENGYTNPNWLEYHKEETINIFGKVHYKKNKLEFNIDYFNKVSINNV